jgi:hypothetical protein
MLRICSYLVHKGYTGARRKAPKDLEDSSEGATALSLHSTNVEVTGSQEEQHFELDDQMSMLKGERDEAEAESLTCIPHSVAQDSPRFGVLDPAIVEKADRERAEVAARVNRIREQAAKIAGAMGYDPAKLQVSTEEKMFEAGGMRFRTTGEAFLENGMEESKGTIRIYVDRDAPKLDPAVVAHEVQHQRTQAVLNAYQTQKQRLVEDSRIGGGVPGKDNPLATDGGIKPGYEKDYPVYAAMWPVWEKPAAAEFIEANGVSEYSRAWWQDFKAHQHEAGSWSRAELAIHETLAEMARNAYNTGDIGGNKLFRDLYRTVNKQFRALRDQHVGAAGIQS